MNVQEVSIKESIPSWLQILHNELVRNNFSGTIELNYYKGIVSKKYKKILTKYAVKEVP